MGHGHEPSMKIPKAETYKLEDAPQLIPLQEELAKKGLKDPWLRNHVWKFQPKFGTNRSRALTFIFRGWKVGVAAFLITIATEKALGIDYKHDHHEEHGEVEHH